MGPYSGNSARYPSDFTIPDDSTPPTAAEFNVSLRALGDRTANIKSNLAAEVASFVGQIQSLNFPIHPVQGSLGSLRSAAYDRVYRKWYVVGPTENVRASQDGGHNWSAASEIAAVGSNEDCYGIDFDNAGNAVVSTESRYIFELTASTGVWTRPDLASYLTPGTTQMIAYDPVHSKWCVIGSNGAATITSTNRTTWSNGVPPANFSSVQNLDMKCNKTTGRLVLVAQVVSSTTIKVRTSDDGGATWATRPDIAIGIGPVDTVALVRDTNLAGRWLLVVNRITGAWNTEVWASTDDGATWSRLCQNAFHALYRCAPCGGSMLVGVSYNPTIDRNEVVRSDDGGAKWYPTGQKVAGAAVRGAFAGEAGVAIVTSSDIYLGAREGATSFAALT